MPFDTLHYSERSSRSSDFFWIGNEAQAAAIFAIKSVPEWELTVALHAEHVAEELLQISSANRAIAALKRMPTATFTDRLCVDLAASCAYGDRSRAFSSLNRLRAKLRRARAKLAIARIVGEA